MNTPACMGWPVPPIEERDEAHFDMWTWQDGRCGACGGKRPDLVLDHDHGTGLERGYLCRRCNRQESVSVHPIWDLWAAGQNPATLLGLELPYSGWGWRDGVELIRIAYPEPTEVEMEAAMEAVRTLLQRPAP